MDTVQDSIGTAKEAVKSIALSGTEPVSGVQGAGTVDDPYDQGNSDKATLSGTEPPSGVSGAGTADRPYDQGNAAEQASSAVSSTEPPSGLRGEGTVDEPYDLGNAPEQATESGTEPVSGKQGKGTVDEPYDQGNQIEQLSEKTDQIVLSQPSPDDPLASPSTTHQGSGNPQMEPSKEQEQIIHETREVAEQAQRGTPAELPKLQSTGTAASGGNFDAAKAGAGQEASRLRYEDREVSPGEMRDGSHAITSGDRGESYTPSKLNKLKDKLKIGRH